MAGTLPTADCVIMRVKKRIRALGPEEAFRTYGRILLYSGPRKSKAIPRTRSNRCRALAQADRGGFTMIDHTRIGRYAAKYRNSDGIYAYFIKRYTPKYGPDSNEAKIEADKVMRDVSRQFMKAIFGQVATAVCGASLDRIFFTVELPELAVNGNVSTVNGLPAGMVREFYHLDPYEAFRLICLAELIEARRFAGTAKSSGSGAAATEDYRERRSLFVRERRETIGSNPGRDEGEQLKQAKRQILARYALLCEFAALDGDTGETAPLPQRRVARGGVHAAMPHGAA